MDTITTSSQPTNAHHEHFYKRVIIIAGLLLGLVVLGTIAYQVIVLKKTLPQADQKLRDQYQLEKIVETQKIFESLAKEIEQAKPLSDTEKNKLAETFAKTEQPVPSDDVLKQFAKENDVLQDQALKAWKLSKGL